MKQRLKRGSIVAAAAAMVGLAAAQYMKLGQPVGIMIAIGLIGFFLGFAFELRLK